MSKVIGKREAMRLAKERLSGHVCNMDLQEFYGDDLLDEWDDDTGKNDVILSDAMMSLGRRLRKQWVKNEQ